MSKPLLLSILLSSTKPPNNDHQHQQSLPSLVKWLVHERLPKPPVKKLFHALFSRRWPEGPTTGGPEGPDLCVWWATWEIKEYFKALGIQTESSLLNLLTDLV